MIKVVDSNEFREEIKKSSLTLVDFYADWCGPCKMLGPVIERISNLDEYKDITFLKVNVDNSQDLASEYSIMSIPAVFAFKNGKVIDKSIGLINDSEFKFFISENK